MRYSGRWYPLEAPIFPLPEGVQPRSGASYLEAFASNVVRLYIRNDRLIAETESGMTHIVGAKSLASLKQSPEHFE